MVKLSPFAIFCLGTVVSAQAVRNNHLVPLTNWQAPLYWQPSRAEAEAANIRPPSPDATMPVGSLVFVAMTPCRVVDTRSNCTANPNLCTNVQFGPPSLSTNTTRSFPIQLSPTCTIPPNAMAYSFNVTMIPNPAGSFAGYVTVWNTAASPNTPPTAATILDYPTADIRSNAAIVPAGINNGSVSAITNATNPLDLTIDINGYYAPQTGITLAQGTVSAPSLSFSGDAETGIFSSGTGSLSLTTGGTAALTVGSTGDVELTGSIRKGGTLFLHNLGTGSAAFGLGALANGTGSYSTASGYQSLTANTTGGYNTASGYQSLASNTTGSDNVAFGHQALNANTTGGFNTAIGAFSLWINNTGGHNTATGHQALLVNTTGTYNTASGDGALGSNSTGTGNTAVGGGALANSTMGSNNTAYGSDSLSLNMTGSNNVAMGNQAGFNIGGSNNIDIGNLGGGNDGTSANSGVIRIGTSGTQTSFFAAGILGATAPSGVEVFIGTGGQLGTVQSSRRYKEDIEDLGDDSAGLLRLRPVKFRYKQPHADGSKPIDYGLIAEEVAEVYPDLVVKNDRGEIETVQYHKLTPMLLNELEKEHETIQTLQAKLEALQKVVEALASSKDR